jgi:hypothetical protein
VFCIDKWLCVTCHTQPCRPCAGTHIMHYLPQGVESSPRGSWGICAPALPEVLAHNAQSVAPLRVTLTELGHTQPPTPLRTDNSTASGILNENIKQKTSKAMDIRYHWLTDRVRQKQFDVYWRPGRENLGDYHTKHHSAQHHKYMRGLILHQANSLQVLRGCVRLPPLSQPSLRAHTDTRTNPSAQRATQLRSVLARVYAVSRKNKITTTVP